MSDWNNAAGPATTAAATAATKSSRPVAAQSTAIRKLSLAACRSDGSYVSPQPVPNLDPCVQNLWPFPLAAREEDVLLTSSPTSLHRSKIHPRADPGCHFEMGPLEPQLRLQDLPLQPGPRGPSPTIRPGPERRPKRVGGGSAEQTSAEPHSGARGWIPFDYRASRASEASHIGPQQSTALHKRIFGQYTLAA